MTGKLKKIIKFVAYIGSALVVFFLGSNALSVSKGEPPHIKEVYADIPHTGGWGNGDDSGDM